jgi:C-terminal processing protease CtpA/Prc
MTGWVDGAEAQPAPAEATGNAVRLFPPKVIAEDFRDLYRQLQQAHRDLYANVSRAEYDKLFRRMLAEITRPETASQAAIRFQRFVAFGRIAHARIDKVVLDFRTYRENGGKIFPLLLRIKRNRPFVVQNLSGIEAVRPGDEIVAINGRPAHWWLAKAWESLSADNAYMAHTLLEFRFAHHLWLELGSVQQFTLTLHRDGRNLEVLVPARTQPEMKAAGSSQPPLLELDWDERVLRLQPDGVAYLRPGPFYNNAPGASDIYDERAFAGFIDSAFEAIIAAGATRLLIDLRDNPGGDNSFSDRMIAWFATRPFRFASAIRIKVSPQAVASNRRRIEAAGAQGNAGSEALATAYAGRQPGEIIDSPVPVTAPRDGSRFTGQVYVLVNRHSYSNATSAAALIQDYRFGTIIGEETSDLATTLGAMEAFRLPRTGIEIGFPKSLIIRPNGSLERRGVVPELAIETPMIEGADDRVLRRAFELVGTHKG